MNVIWEKVNVGTMGHENEFGEVEVDFHAMHVDEAEKQFDQRVLPVLEALGSVLLIVGRGNHSEGHISKLKPALRRRIQTHRKKKSLGQ
jgi:DNA-nicking Smr family endonuclease